MTSADLPDEAVELFRQAPEGFIAARDELVTRLRDDGREDDAAIVKRLRKPTVVAWALDQLSVLVPDGVQALLDAGAEMRSAQQAALSSKRGATDRLRAAGAARKEAVANLASAANNALEESGRGADAHADAIVQALETCAVDPEAGSALAAGTLDRPPAASPGFGDMFGLVSIEGGREAAAPDERSGASAVGKRGSSPADLAELEALVARLRRDRDATARRAGKARDAADGFAHELEGMRRRLAVVEQKHAAAEAAAGEAELEAARAERALTEAAKRLDAAADADA